MKINGGGAGDVITVLSDDVTIKDLRVYNGEDGIHADNADNLVLDNVDSRLKTMTTASMSTILASRARQVTVIGDRDDGQYFLNQDDGLEFDFVNEHLLLTDVRARDNFGDGLDVEDADLVEVYNGLFVRSAEDGIEIDRVTELIVDDTPVNDKVSDGLDVEYAGTLHISGSNFIGNAEDGLELDYIDVLIDLDVLTVASNGGDGLNIADSNALIDIDRGWYHSNGEDGIEVDRITGNIDIFRAIARLNYLDGLNVDDAADIAIEGNGFSHNGDDGIDLDNVGLSDFVGCIRGIQQ